MESWANSPLLHSSPASPRGQEPIADDSPSHLANASAPVVENWIARKAAAVMEAFVSFDPNDSSVNINPSLLCAVEKAVVVLGLPWPHKFVYTCCCGVELIPVLATDGRCVMGIIIVKVLRLVQCFLHRRCFDIKSIFYNP